MYFYNTILLNNGSYVKTHQKASPILLLLNFTLLFTAPVSSQLMHFEAPLSQLYQNGLKSLQQGDSLAAYQTIQSAHFFEPNALILLFITIYYQWL